VIYGAFVIHSVAQLVSMHTTADIGHTAEVLLDFLTLELWDLSVELHLETLVNCL